jgi:hypothetical protein
MIFFRKWQLTPSFSIVYRKQFESCFIDWVNLTVDICKSQIITIDDKTIRGEKPYN